jgi:hypothetical protein
MMIPLCEEYKLLSSSLCSVFQRLVTSSPVQHPVEAEKEYEKERERA